MISLTGRAIGTSKTDLAMAIAISIAMFWVIALFPSDSIAQVDNANPDKIIAGTIVAPPFAMKTAVGTWEGLSINLWQAIASELGAQYEIRAYDTIEQILEEIENHNLDVAIALMVTEQRETILDMSHSYYRSGYAIATSEDISRRGWSGFFGRMNIARVFSAIGLLILLWLIAGGAVWIFEGRRNRDMVSAGRKNRPVRRRVNEEVKNENLSR